MWRGTESSQGRLLDRRRSLGGYGPRGGSDPRHFEKRSLSGGASRRNPDDPSWRERLGSQEGASGTSGWWLMTTAVCAHRPWVQIYERVTDDMRLAFCQRCGASSEWY